MYYTQVLAIQAEILNLPGSHLVQCKFDTCFPSSSLSYLQSHFRTLDRIISKSGCWSRPLPHSNLSRVPYCPFSFFFFLIALFLTWIWWCRAFPEPSSWKSVHSFVFPETTKKYSHMSLSKSFYFWILVFKRRFWVVPNFINFGTSWTAVNRMPYKVFPSHTAILMRAACGCRIALLCLARGFWGCAFFPIF